MAAKTENRYASIYIDGKAADDTIAGLRKASRELRNELDKLPRSSAEFAEKSKQFQEVEGRLKSIREEARGVGGAFSNLKGELASIGKGMLAGLSVAGAIEAGRKVITQNAALSDSFAGVMKTTGLTLVEVESLNRSLSQLNTRTAKEELLGLAQVAGRLGISGVKDVEAFVRAADKIGVALGEDLGGTESAVTSLGKLADIFDIKDLYGIEGALLKVGSAINSLGAAGAAKESNLINFSERLAGIAPAADISLPAVLGMAATLDELGQSMEKSSTAIGQFLVDMGVDTPKYAKLAGMSVKEFSALLKRDANEAFLLVLEKSKSAGGGLEALASAMSDLEVKNSGSIAAIGALANNVDKLREKQALANTEFDAGTSIMDEFDTVNTNLAANLEKIWNKIGLIWESGGIRNWLTSLTGAMVDNRTVAERLTSELDHQKKKSDDLEESLQPLIDRYEKLSSKGNLNAAEHRELKQVINDISKILPESVSEWDKYGNVIALNIGYVNQLNDAQKRLFDAKHKNVINELQDKYESAMARMENASKRLASINMQIRNNPEDAKLLGWRRNVDKEKTEEYLERWKAEGYEAVKALQKMNQELSDEQKKLLLEIDIDVEASTIAMTKHSSSVFNNEKALESRLKVLQAELKSGKLTAQQYKETEAAIVSLNGRLKELNEEESPRTVGRRPSSTREKGMQRELERNAEQYDKLAKQNEAFRKAQEIADLSWFEKEIAQEKAKYDKQIEEWEVFLQRKNLTEQQTTEARAAITKLEEDRDAAIAKKEIALEEETIEKLSELRERLSDARRTQREKEEAEIEKYYNDLQEKYQGNPEMLAIIEENRASDLADAKIREEKRFHEEAKKLREAADLSKLSGADRELAEITLKYDAEIEALREKYSQELMLKEEFEAAIDAINERRQAEIDAREIEREQYKREQMKNLALEAAQSTADALFAISANNADAELNRRLDQIGQAREQELKAVNLTEAQKKAINDKYDAMERKEKERAWKSQQKADILQAGINTALAVTRALPNWINAAAVGIAGAAQIAVIASKPVPQFFHGGFTGEKPEGWVRKPTIFTNSSSGNAFSAGENWQTEYVVSSEQLRNPMVADFVSMMEANRLSSASTMMPQNTVVQSTTDTSKLEGLMMQMIAAYQDTQDKKVVLVYHDLEETRDKKVSIEHQANA